MAARTDTEKAARAIKGRPIPRLLARSQFHRTLIWAGPSSLGERSNGPLSRDTQVGFNARRPKPHDYRNAKTKNARGNCNFELAPKGVLLVAQSCLAVVMGDRLTWYDGEASNNSPWLKALAELRQRATREGYCYQHVQAITVAIDQYAEKALGNRDYFLNKPYGVG